LIYRWLLILVLFTPLSGAEEAIIKLDKAPIDLSDYASLQRGARIFMNECSACHSLKYTRYDSLARGIKITDEEGKVLESLVKKNLIFTGDPITSPIYSPMRTEDGAKWFGIAPPDLTLVARYRGVDWIYTYLRSFYLDPNRQWGVNNLVYPDVAMPHVLINLQGEQQLVDGSLKLVKKGKLSVVEYDRAMADLVNFLSFVSEPVQLERRKIGAWVLVFLGIFLVFSYLLKKEYWKDVH